MTDLRATQFGLDAVESDGGEVRETQFGLDVVESEGGVLIETKFGLDVVESNGGLAVMTQFGLDVFYFIIEPTYITRHVLEQDTGTCLLVMGEDPNKLGLTAPIGSMALKRSGTGGVWFYDGTTWIPK